MDSSYLIQAVLDNLASKRAAVPAEQLAPPPAPGMPPGGDPAAMGGMPPGGDPGAAGMAPPPMPSVEEMAASGDSLAKFLLELDAKVDRLISAVGLLLDRAEVTAPASRILEAGSDLGETPKSAGVPRSSWLEPRPVKAGPDRQFNQQVSQSGVQSRMQPAKPVARPASNLRTHQPVEASRGAVHDEHGKLSTLGRVGEPGDGGAEVIQTGITMLPPKSATILKHIRSARAG